MVRREQKETSWSLSYPGEVEVGNLHKKILILASFVCQQAGVEHVELRTQSHTLHFSVTTMEMWEAKCQIVFGFTIRLLIKRSFFLPPNFMFR